MKLLTSALFIACIAVAATTARADSWNLPEVSTHLSSDGRWRFTVTPRELSSQLDYFQDKVDGKAKAGSRTGGGNTARGQMERRTDQGWITVWHGNLLNDVAPVDVLVTTNGQVATLDNWHGMGHGDNVVVLYGSSGAPVCSLTLYDLFPSVVVDNFPRSVSSILWRDKPRLSQTEQMLSLTIASPAPLRVKNDTLDMLGESFELGLRMSDCSMSPPSQEVWHAVLATAEHSAADDRKQRLEWRAQFVAPLSAPRNDDEKAWNNYLAQAWHRIQPEAESDYPRIQYLLPDGQPGHEASLKELRHELELLTQWSDTLLAGAAAPKELVQIVREFAADKPRNSLRSKQLGFALSAGDFAAVREALRPTGARLVQIDPSHPLPQSEANLRWLERSEREQAAESAQHEQRASRRKTWWSGY